MTATHDQFFADIVLISKLQDNAKQSFLYISFSRLYFLLLFFFLCKHLYRFKAVVVKPLWSHKEILGLQNWNFLDIFIIVRNYVSEDL